MKNIDELKNFIVETLENKKAESIEVIDIEEKSDIAKYIIISSARSTKHASSLADFLSLEIKHKTNLNTKIDGIDKGDWVVVDVADIIIHIFHHETREKYNLEKIWKEKGYIR